jgi:NAD(P)-dependent dehydrogenase (short-subunit alcohol dehydrogenase family)
LQDEVTALYKENSLGYSPPRIVGVVAPLTEPKKCCDSIVAGVTEHFGKVNILVQNAAVAELCAIDDIDQGHITRSLTGNIETAILLVQALLPLFRPDSRIVNISSEAARLSRPRGLVYSACKAALESMTRVWADELGTRPGMERTTVNALSVGMTMTDLMANHPPNKRRDEMMDRESSKVSVGKRFGTVDDIAEIAGWLCSEGSRWVTGSVSCANGGVTKIL